MLNSDEIQQFERDGFFVNRRLHDGELLNRMRDAFDQLAGLRILEFKGFGTDGHGY